MRVISLFSGIGAFEKALTNLGIEHEVVNYCEIDKYASKSYSVLHGVDESKNLGDITKVDIESLPVDIDLLTHGSPCQDFSVAGKGLGGDGGTRSSLMWNSVEIIRHCKPAVVIWENVKNVLSKKHIHNFEKYVNELGKMGYTSYHQVLNAKNYGIPQNRERIFCISVLGEHKPYVFPEPFDNGLRLKDLLLDSVDEKYYIKSEKVKNLIEQIKGDSVRQIGYIKKSENGVQHQSNTVYSAEYFSPTLSAGDYKSPIKIECIQVSDQATKFDKTIDVANTLMARDYKGFGNQGMTAVICASRGRLNDDGKYEQRLYVNEKGVSNTLTTATKDNYVLEKKCDVVIGSTQKNAYVGDGTISPTLTSAMGAGGGNIPMIASCEPRRLGGIFDKEGSKHQAGSVWDSEGVAPTLDTMQGGYRQPCIIDDPMVKVKVGNKKGYDVAKVGDSINVAYPTSETRRGRVGHGVVQTLDTAATHAVLEYDYRIRKLTPLECWRLMGFDDSDCKKVEQAGISNTQLYKQAGNSIVVNVLMEIYKNLFF